MNDPIETTSVYSARVRYYDAIYSWKDYAAEANRLHAVIAAAGFPDGARLLDAACGTGKHLELLSAWYAGDGFDLNDGMLHHARARLPGARLWQASMADFQVEAPYDVITCLFSAIGYLMNEAELRAAARCFAAALKPGGLMLIEPWFTTEQWNTGRPHAVHYNSPDLSLARVNIADRRDDVAVMDMHWLVAERGRPVEHFVERHELWLCPRDTFAAAFEAAGLEIHFDPDGLMTGRGLWICRRPMC